MTKRARLFQDRFAIELSMSSSNPREHKRIGRGVHYFECAIWDRVGEDAVLADSLVKFTQNLAMEQHRLSTITKCLAEASYFDSVGHRPLGRRRLGP